MNGLAASKAAGVSLVYAPPGAPAAVAAGNLNVVAYCYPKPSENYAVAAVAAGAVGTNAFDFYMPAGVEFALSFGYPIAFPKSIVLPTDVSGNIIPCAPAPASILEISPLGRVSAFGWIANPIVPFCYAVFAPCH